MIPLESVQTLGQGLIRPEGVMALDNGDIVAADGRGCLSRTSPDGRTVYFGQLEGAPNGICVDTEGRVIVANIGNGQVQRVRPDGAHEVILTHAQGKPISQPNFPFLDKKGRLWVSNSSYRPDVNESLRQPAPDGCLVMMDQSRARIVAEGVFFSNGVALDEPEEWVYLAETITRTILRYRLKADGALEEPEIYGPSPLAEAGFPDGIAFDQAANLWVTFPSMNAVGYITPAQKLVMVLEDKPGRVLKRPTNICFGGADLKTAYLGSLDGRSIPFFRVEHPGLRLVHQHAGQAE